MNGTHPDPLPDLGDYLSTGPAAHRLQVSTEQVRRYIRDGTLPAVRGAQWFLIPRAAVEQLAAQRAQRRAREDR